MNSLHPSVTTVPSSAPAVRITNTKGPVKLKEVAFQTNTSTFGASATSALTPPKTSGSSRKIQELEQAAQLDMLLNTAASSKSSSPYKSRTCATPTSNGPSSESFEDNYVTNELSK